MEAMDGGQNIDQNMNDDSPRFFYISISLEFIIISFVALINTSVALNFGVFEFLFLVVIIVCLVTLINIQK